MRVQVAQAWSRRVQCGLFALATLMTSAPAFSAETRADAAAVAKVLGTLQAAPSTESPVVDTNDQGFIHFLASPPGGRFATGAAQAKQGPEAAAREYLATHAAAFGVDNPKISFSLENIQTNGGFTYVRLQQCYAGLKVFSAQVIVQINADGDIQAINSDVLTDTALLDSGALATTPALDAAQAWTRATAWMTQEHPDSAASDYSSPVPAALVVYSPAVLGLQGPLRVVWQMEVQGATDSEQVDEWVFVDSLAGGVIQHFPKRPGIMNRKISDARNTFYDSLWEINVRVEGGAQSTTVPEINAVYDFLGDAYTYYMNLFQRDSWDGAGAPLKAMVRLPFLNAFSATNTPTGDDVSNSGIFGLYFGTGFVTDDVVAHEYAHSVTGAVAGFSYAGQSGALSEMYSDMWGEFVDFSNGRGDDTPNYRWVMGEDINLSGLGFVVRYMKDPTVFGDPDRLRSPYWDPFEEVHKNAGVGDKLIYLLTDGDTFNSYEIAPFGEERVSKLYYSALYLLTSGASYSDLAHALGTAAVNQGYSFSDRLNLADAIRAVEIEPVSGLRDYLPGLANFRATPTLKSGNPVIALTWLNPGDHRYQGLRHPYGTAQVYRSETGFIVDPTGQQPIASGAINNHLDEDVAAGTRYYYTVIVPMDYNLPQIAFAQAVAGETAVGTLSEAFGYDGTTGQHDPFDLDFKQLTYTPVGPPMDTLSGTGSLTDYSSYALSVVGGVSGFPVSKDAPGKNYALPLTSGQTTQHFIANDLYQTTFPFFGREYGVMTIGANGYISFSPIVSSDVLNTATLDAHFTVPRISFLFSILAPNAAGEVWMKGMKDKMVLTFSSVPEITPLELYATKGNSVQVELFFSGLIRITYMEVNAENAIVGISDGRGTVPPLSALFPSVDLVKITDNLSAFPAAVPQLHLAPMTPVYVQEEGVVSFPVQAEPATDVRFSASWNHNIPVPLTDNGDGTAVFNWTPTLDDAGFYTLRIIAERGAAETLEIAYQDVKMQVYNTLSPPSVTRAALATDQPGDDPTQSRLILPGIPLIAQYTYFHPEMASNPEVYREGYSLIYWFKNDELIQAYADQTVIPAKATKPGERWYYKVVPYTKSGIAGPDATSPVATISAEPQVKAVIPAFGLVSGGEVVRIQGRQFDGAQKVLFGGVSASNIRVISANEIEVTTPVYSGGLTLDGQSAEGAVDFIDVVDVTVISAKGTGLLADAFTYKAVDTPGADNAACGPQGRDSLGSDLLVVLLAVVALLSGHIRYFFRRG